MYLYNQYETIASKRVMVFLMYIFYNGEEWLQGGSTWKKSNALKIKKTHKNIKNLRKLHTTKGRKEASLYLIEGEHLYLAALQNQIELKEIIITEKFIDQVTETTAAVTLVSDEVMQALSQTETAPGIICVLEIPAEPEILIEPEI